MKNCITLLNFALLLTHSAPAWASVIYVSGDQTGTWSADTVIVTAEVRVPPGQSLTVLPGVKVLFSVYCKLIVDSAATLRAVGTSVDSIRFDALQDTAHWHGIRFIGAADSCRLEYCQITHGNASGTGEDGYGGAIYCEQSGLTVNHSSINQNSAAFGGGIYCRYSNPTIIGNTLSENSASAEGGGMYLYHTYYSAYSEPITDNCIIGNSGNLRGGGIYYRDSNPELINCTIFGNSSNLGGGGICSGLYSSAILINCLLWANIPQQISEFGSTAQVIYSNIQDGWPGLGNIQDYPVFVDTSQNDYRLQWGSPCIDSGAPNSIYNDPDGTRADMGAFFYDQSLPVRILLTPYNAPIQIPASGGSFQYAIQATNIATSTLQVPVWCDVTLPNGNPYGPVLGPVTISLASGQTLSRVRTQMVPAGAPAGLYHYNAYAVAAGDTSADSFTFVKLGAGGWGLDAGSWTNTGESFDLAGVEGQLAAPMPELFHISISPNPFNPTTAISYELRAASFVNLNIYDIAGRLVTELVNGWRDAGEHQITIDGSGLPSGLYFAELGAGGYNQVQKMVLLK